MSVVAISQRFRAPVSMWSLKARPRTEMGIVATMRYQPIRASSPGRRSFRRPGSRSQRRARGTSANQARVIRQRSFQK